jgi:methylmalonyl-CoA/ethylmalonyl-CoA epimerase
MIEELLARIGGGFFQQAFVVSDFDAATRACVDGLGCSPFVSLPATSLPYWYRGREVECAIALGFARSGNVQIELLQPMSGEGLHVEFLAQNGPGAHHLGYLVDSIDAELAATDFEKVMSGQFGSLRFCYLDTWDALGSYVELVEDPDEMMKQLMPWR